MDTTEHAGDRIRTRLTELFRINRLASIDGSAGRIRRTRSSFDLVSAATRQRTRHL